MLEAVEVMLSTDVAELVIAAIEPAEGSTATLAA